MLKDFFPQDKRYKECTLLTFEGSKFMTKKKVELVFNFYSQFL